MILSQQSFGVPKPTLKPPLRPWFRHRAGLQQHAFRPTTFWWENSRSMTSHARDTCTKNGPGNSDFAPEIKLGGLKMIIFFLGGTTEFISYNCKFNYHYSFPCTLSWLLWLICLRATPTWGVTFLRFLQHLCQLMQIFVPINSISLPHACESNTNI